MDVRVWIKFLITSALIVAISESGKSGKHSKLVAAILASLPLTSLLALTWLYVDERNNEPPAALSMSIFWMVIPSLIFFPVFTLLLRAHLSFVISMVIGIVVIAGGYYIYLALPKKIGISL